MKFALRSDHRIGHTVWLGDGSSFKDPFVGIIVGEGWPLPVEIRTSNGRKVVQLAEDLTLVPEDFSEDVKAVIELWKKGREFSDVPREIAMARLYS